MDNSSNYVLKTHSKFKKGKLSLCFAIFLIGGGGPFCNARFSSSGGAHTGMVQSPAHCAPLMHVPPEIHLQL